MPRTLYTRTMGTKDIAHHRLQSQMIVAPTLTNPADVVRHLGAVQAQDYGQALWAIGLRTKDATKQTIEQAIADGKILRTWPMRGTIHFVPSEDAAWMLSISTPRTIAAAKSRHASLDIDDEKLRRAGDIFDEQLGGGKRLDRPTLMAALNAGGLDVSEQRGYHMLWYWSQLGKVCIGPMQGKQQTFALLREWAPGQRELSREEGLIELTRRYFASHGPATLADFCTWANLLKSEATQALSHVRGELESITVEGVEYWFSPDIAPVSSRALLDTYLLAGFEEYLLGYKDRSAVLPAAFTATSYKNGIFFPIIVHDGQVVGTWKRVIGPKKISIVFEPFVPLSPEVLARCRQKADRYGEFMGLPIATTG